MAGSLSTDAQGVGWTLKVLRSDGVNSSEFPIGYTAPVLSSVSPLSGPVVGGTTITVTGSSMGFANAAVLMFGDRALALSYAPAALGQLTAVCASIGWLGSFVQMCAGDGRGAGVGRRDADILPAAEPDDRWRDGADIERAVVVVPVRRCGGCCCCCSCRVLAAACALGVVHVSLFGCRAVAAESDRGRGADDTDGHGRRRGAGDIWRELWIWEPVLRPVVGDDR